jgi:hypothetical protein
MSIVSVTTHFSSDVFASTSKFYSAVSLFNLSLATTAKLNLEGSARDWLLSSLLRF